MHAEDLMVRAVLHLIIGIRCIMDKTPPTSSWTGDFALNCSQGRSSTSAKTLSRAMTNSWVEPPQPAMAD